MVNTKTSISKKVLALVLAVACTIAFTPAIAFTQSANAATGGDVSTSAEAIAALGGAANAVDNGSSGDTISIKLVKDSTITLDKAINIASGKTLKITSQSTSATATKITAAAGFKAFSLESKASIDLEGPMTVTGGEGTAAGSAGFACVDGTAMTTGTITIGEDAIVKGGAATITDKNGGDAIVVNGSSTAVTTKVGTVVLNGTATGGAAYSTPGTGAAGYGVNFNAATTANILVNFSGTGTASSTSPDVLAAKVNATFTAVKSTTNSTNITDLTKLVQGNVLTIKTAAGAADTVYTVNITKTLDGKTTTVATGTGAASGAATAEYTIASTDAGATFSATVTQKDKFGSALNSLVGTPKVLAAASIADISESTSALNADHECVVGSTVTLQNGAVASESNVNYQWYKNASDSTTGGTPVASTTETTAAGAGSTTLTVDTASAGTTYYYLVATDNDTGAVATSKTFKVVVKTVGFTTDLEKEYNVNATDTDINLHVVLNKAVTSYQWYKNTTTGDVNGTGWAKVGTSVATYTIPTAPAAGNTVYYYCAATVGTGTTAVTYNSTVAAVKSSEGPVLNTSDKTYNMASATYALNETADALNVVINGEGTAVSYQWYTNTTGKVDTSADSKLGLAVTNSNSSSVVPTTKATADTTYYYCVVTQNNKTVTTDVAKITYQEFAFTTQPADKTVYVGKDATLKVNYVGNGTVKWYKTADKAVTTVGATGVTGATTATTDSKTLGIDTDAVGTYYYFAVVTTNGTAKTSNVATVTVKAYPAVGTKFTSGAAKYKVTVAATAAAKGSVVVYAPAKNSSTKVTVPATVTKSSVTYNVVGIASKAFAKSKCKTLTIKSKMLTKAGVKNSLKGSKVTTVKVPSSKVKTYKKYFTKANCGKTVTVKKY